MDIPLLTDSFEIRSHNKKNIRDTWPYKERANDSDLRKAVELLYTYNDSGLTCAKHLAPLITRFVDSAVEANNQHHITGTWSVVLTVQYNSS